jgi:hypothetical protein
LQCPFRLSPRLPNCVSSRIMRHSRISESGRKCEREWNKCWSVPAVVRAWVPAYEKSYLTLLPEITMVTAKRRKARMEGRQEKEKERKEPRGMMQKEKRPTRSDKIW